jgi:hypothetical protein
MRNVAIALVLAAVVLSGCGGGPASSARTPSDPSSAATGPRPPSSPGSSEPSPSSPAKTPAAAESPSGNAPPVHAYRRYVAAVDAMTATGGEQTRHLSRVATGVLLRAVLDQARTYRRLRIRTTGQTRILWARLVDVTHTSKTQVTVRSCYDTAETRPVDAAHRSALKPGAPTRWQDDTQMYLTSGTWKATSTKSRPAPC